MFHLNDTSPDRLAEFLTPLEQQEGAVDQLAQCAHEQEKFIDASQTDALLQLLGRRQTLIAGITQRHQQLSELAQAVRSGEIALSQTQRAGIRSRVEGISQRLAEVLAHDERAQTQLRDQQKTLRNDMTTHDSAQSAHRAYTAAPTVHTTGMLGHNRFADERG